jgi:hypothetical protein
MKHPGHTYLGFVPAISERGTTGVVGCGLAMKEVDTWLSARFRGPSGAFPASVHLLAATLPSDKAGEAGAL